MRSFRFLLHAAWDLLLLRSKDPPLLSLSICLSEYPYTYRCMRRVKLARQMRMLMLFSTVFFPEFYMDSCDHLS